MSRALQSARAFFWASMVLLVFQVGRSGAEDPVEDVKPDRTPRRASEVLRADLDGVVIPATAAYLAAAVEEAQRGGYEAVLIVINTPGGRVDSTREIAQAFLSADVPVITYVSPAGGQAASAGTFITMAGHIAVMTPGTNIGAAHPVTAGGKDPEADGSKHMGKKVENDIAAFARSIAQERNRNEEWAEEAVRESVSVTAREAVELKVVDLTARSVSELLDAIDGRVVALPGGDQTLHTKGAVVTQFPMTIQQRAMAFLGNPAALYLLGMMGVLGLMMEMYNPGMIVPGAVGGFCLLLAAIGANVLPVNVSGVVLLFVAAAMFIAEVYVASFGLLTVGGLVCFVLGSMLLLDTANPDFYVDPSIELSWGLIVPTVVAVGGVSGTLGFLIVRAQLRQPKTGVEGMIGEIGKALTEVGPDGGRVRVLAEDWAAHSSETIAQGAEVEILSVKGLKLEVKGR